MARSSSLRAPAPALVNRFAATRCTARRVTAPCRAAPVRAASSEQAAPHAEPRIVSDAQLPQPLPRRALFAGVVSAAALAALPALAEAAPPLLGGTGKTVIITGCNTGIGFDAAGKLAARGYDVIMACRTLTKAEGAAAALRSAAEASGVPLAGSLTPAECDLASLASVRAFAAAFHAQGRPLHRLCLNAGLQFSGDDTVRRTADGFEITVGTNHLGHFLLANLLLPDLKAAGAGARVVVTASEVHDPASPGGAVGPGASLGDLSGLATRGAAFEMVDGKEPYNADKAYKDSKLCNVLFARELARRLAAQNSVVEVVSFGPGLITRTGFFRNQNPLFTALFDFATNDLFHVAESVSGGGDCLVYMATTPSAARLGEAVYRNNDLDGKGGHRFEEGPVSKEAQDDAEAARLWALSAQLVGLQEA